MEELKRSANRYIRCLFVCLAQFFFYCLMLPSTVNVILLTLFSIIFVRCCKWRLKCIYDRFFFNSLMLLSIAKSEHIEWTVSNHQCNYIMRRVWLEWLLNLKIVWLRHLKCAAVCHAEIQRVCGHPVWGRRYNIVLDADDMLIPCIATFFFLCFNVDYEPPTAHMTHNDPFKFQHIFNMKNKIIKNLMEFWCETQSQVTSEIMHFVLLWPP